MAVPFHTYEVVSNHLSHKELKISCGLVVEMDDNYLKCFDPPILDDPTLLSSSRKSSFINSVPPLSVYWTSMVLVTLELHTEFILKNNFPEWLIVMNTLPSVLSVISHTVYLWNYWWNFVNKTELLLNSTDYLIILTPSVFPDALWGWKGD